jgi:hypothetical protein
MKFLLSIAAILLATNSYGNDAAVDDCLELSVKVRHQVSAKPSLVLEIVEKQIAASPGCACEIVKAAIEEVSAEAELVGAIVETAAMTAPEQMRLIAQCALAVAPDALSEIQAVMIRLEPSSGEAGLSAKSAKGPKQPLPDVKPAWNPLDFPGQGIGPSPGTWFYNPIDPVTPIPPVINPPVVEPPVGTPTDPGSQTDVRPR